MADHGKKHYVGEVGLEILLLIGPLEELGGVFDVRIDVKKPDETLVTWDAELITDYDSDWAYVRHVVGPGSESAGIPADLDQAGMYELQAYGKIAGWQGLGETAQLIVWETFS